MALIFKEQEYSFMEHSLLGKADSLANEHLLKPSKKQAIFSA